MPTTFSTKHEWRCERCNLLLAVNQDGNYHIHERNSTQYVTDGTVIATCKRCKTVNQASRQTPLVATAA